MANNYVITSISSVGDALTVTGTVNGTQVTYVGSVAAAGSALGSAVAFENYIAPLLLALVPPPAAVYPGFAGLSFSK